MPECQDSVFPAFSMVWRLRISSLCSKGPHVLKGSLHFGLASVLFAVDMCQTALQAAGRAER